MFISETQEARRAVNTHSWVYTIWKGLLVSLLILVLGADFGRWQKGSTGTASVQDPRETIVLQGLVVRFCESLTV